MPISSIIRKLETVCKWSKREGQHKDGQIQFHGRHNGTTAKEMQNFYISKQTNHVVMHKVVSFLSIITFLFYERISSYQLIGKTND